MTTPGTGTDGGPDQLRTQLEEIAARGIAWEHQEFVPGTSCLAATISADDGMLVGTVAVSAPVAAYEGRIRQAEHLAVSLRAGTV